MEPENIQDNAPKQPEIEVAEEEVVKIKEEPVVKEPVVEEPVGPAPVAPKDKKSKTPAILAVIFAILALAGIGFGVWGMIEKNQADEKQKELTAKVEDVSGKLANCLNNEMVEDTEVVDETEIVKEEVDTEKYIYVGEWGLKIKIPDGLKTVSYEYAYDSGFVGLRIWGVDCLNYQCQHFPDFGNTNKNTSGLGLVARFPKGTEMSPASPPQLIFSDDNYDYYYYHNQVAYSAEINDMSEADWETSTRKMIMNMLTNPDNYSAI